jgi:hypothetical protein
MAERAVHLPPLDVFDQRVLNLALTAFFAGSLPPGGSDSALLTGFVRLTDATARYYNDARQSFLDWSDSPSGEGFGTFFRGVSELETCITTLHRATRYADALVRSQGAPPIDRNLDLPRKRDIYLLRRMRDAIEHADRDIVSDRDGDGRSAAIDPRGHASVIGEHRISHSDLHRWVVLMSTLAQHLIDNKDWDLTPWAGP